MRNVTEEEKENIANNILRVYGMPDVYRVALDKLWEHQIPESSTEWINNLANMKERLDDLNKEIKKLNDEYTAQCYLGIGMFAILTEEDTK